MEHIRLPLWTGKSMGNILFTGAWVTDLMKITWHGCAWWAWEQQILTLSHIHHFCQLIRSRHKRAIHLYRFCLPDSRVFLCLKKYADLPANLKQRQAKTQGASLLCILGQQCSLLRADSCSWLEMWMPAWCPRNPALLPWSLGPGSWQTFVLVGWE